MAARATRQRASSGDEVGPPDHRGEAFIWAVIGQRGTGKTTLLARLLTGPLRGRFDRVFLFSPAVFRSEALRALSDDDRGLKKIPTFSREMLRKIFATFEKENNKRAASGRDLMRVLVVLDDVDAIPEFVKNTTSGLHPLLKYAYESRECGISLLITAHDPLSLPTRLLRSGCDRIEYMPGVSKKSREVFADMFAPSRSFGRELERLAYMPIPDRQRVRPRVVVELGRRPGVYVDEKGRTLPLRKNEYAGGAAGTKSRAADR